MYTQFKQSAKSEAGFTLVELMVVATIMVAIAAFAVPNLMNAVHISRLRAGASNFSGVIQAARIRAVQDDRFYSVYILTGSAQQAFVDIYPQSNTGASGSGGTSIDYRDPITLIPAQITPTASGSAPNTAALKSLFLPSGSGLTVKDASLSSSPVTFGPRGLPCTSQTATGGTVCDSSGGATAFWIFFQDSNTQAWEAVTVSPAGRIQKWQYNSTWSKI